MLHRPAKQALGRTLPEKIHARACKPSTCLVAFGSLHSTKTVRIGCACTFCGDTSTAAAQRVRGVELAYLVFDYLAEVTLSIMAGARMKQPDAGYASDFVEVLTPLPGNIAATRIRVISNPSGVNPRACAAALAAACAQAGVQLKIAVLHGDNLQARLGELAKADWMRHCLDPQTGKLSRRYLPGSHSLNFLLENALGGGGASLRIHVQGKAFAQPLLELPVPRALAATLRGMTLFSATGFCWKTLRGFPP